MRSIACRKRSSFFRRDLTRWLLPLAIYFFAASAAGDSNFNALLKKLEHGEDFRLRVQAALQLGKTQNSKARKPLEGALDDSNASVRAAAAAALKTLGDKRALSSLREHRLDRSAAVRAQIKAAIKSLKAGAEAQPARVLVKVGEMHNGTRVRSTRVVGALKKASREKLAELPGVALLDDGADVSDESKRRQLPVVMVTGQIRKLKASRQGDVVVYSASVEYILHRMPGASIAARVSGTASAEASDAELRDRRRAAEIRRFVLEAAIASAIRNAPKALTAASER